MSFASSRTRAGLGVVLSLLVLAIGCGKKDPTPVAPVKPPDKTQIDPSRPAEGVNLAGLIPTDVAAFGSVNVQTLWTSAEGKRVRKLLESIEDGKPLKQMEEELGVAPGDIDRVVFVFVEIGDDPVVLIASSKPYDKEKVRKSIESKSFGSYVPPKVQEEEYKGKKLIIQPILSYSVSEVGGGPSRDKDKKSAPPKDKGGERPTPKVDSEAGRAVSFANDHTFALGRTRIVKRWLDKTEKPASGPLSGAVAKLGQHCVVVGFNPSALPAKATGALPAALKPLAKAKTATAVGDFGAESRLKINVEFPDDASAQDGEKAVAAGLGMLAFVLPQGVEELERDLKRQPDNPFAPPILKAAKEFQDSLANVKPTRDGSSLSMALAVKTEIPEVSSEDLARVRLAALRAKHMNNGKQIGLSFHNWASTYGDGWPPAAICDKDGKPLLSWRVMILPWIEQDALFKEFKLDQAWDSPHNKKLLDRMPMTYRLPGADARDTQTHYQILVGPGTLYPTFGKAADAAASGRNGVPSGLRGMLAGFGVANIPDGTSNTVLIIEAANAVPWTKPEDVMYDPQKPLPKFGKLLPDQFLVGMADGSVRMIKMKVSEKTLRSAIEPSDGKPLGQDWE